MFFLFGRSCKNDLKDFSNQNCFIFDHNVSVSVSVSVLPRHCSFVLTKIDEDLGNKNKNGIERRQQSASTENQTAETLGSTVCFAEFEVLAGKKN